MMIQKRFKDLFWGGFPRGSHPWTDTMSFWVGDHGRTHLHSISAGE
ncbi:MAG: hypothetical protein QNJ26_20900 [Desulfobacterales bacterium]|nr:hypothetical protein [Desulfobacterales bacterium]